MSKDGHDVDELIPSNVGLIPPFSLLTSLPSLLFLMAWQAPMRLQDMVKIGENTWGNK